MAVSASRRTTVQIVLLPRWSVVKTVPSSVSSTTRVGNWGSQPAVHTRSLLGRKAHLDGSGQTHVLAWAHPLLLVRLPTVRLLRPHLIIAYRAPRARPPHASR